MDRFGNYVIERELGRGGMGVVYAARHAILGHQVGLKILHAELSQREDVVQRFFNEARAAAAIDHPGIVRVHDVGIAGHGAFLVMDLLAGESLAQRLKTQGPMTVPLAVAVTRQIAGALAAAHAVGIVHRDLKPDNIFLVDDARAPQRMHVVLLDFGVAKLTGELQSGDLKTKTGALLGTPHYMSPEQCDGERTIDLRSDLYSLGCMVFQMVSGKLPFEGGIGAVIGAHLHVPAPALRSALPTAPPEIEVVVARLMMKDPAARFGSAAELVTALDAWSPSARDHATPAPPHAFDMSVAETLPIGLSSQPTVDSVTPPPSERAANARPLSQPTVDSIAPARSERASNARPAIKSADEVPGDTVRDVPVAPQRERSRRGVLFAGAAFGLIGLCVLVFALTRKQGGAVHDAAIVAHAADAHAVDAAIAMAVDAANDGLIDQPTDEVLELDASIGANRIDATVAMRRDASARDAALVARVDADIDAGAIAQAVDAMPTTAEEAAFQKQFARVANAESDWEASRNFMMLEVIAPRDPRLARAREDAKKTIRKLARDDYRKAIHLALVEHDWATGLAKCRESGDVVRVDITVQCTVFACIGKDDVKLEIWGGGIPPPPQSTMLDYIEKFCLRFRAP